MSKIVIVYHSGYGHTAKVAEAVAEGSGGALLAIDAEGNLPEGGWEQLAAARCHRLRLAHLHGQRELAVQEVRRRVVQALVRPGLAQQAGRRLHQLGHA
jgi:flavodoxin